MASQTIENYLKVLFHLSQQKNEINTVDIAKALQVSMPTVNSMVKKLADSNYLVYEKYKPLKITEKGKIQAALIIRKHRLVEMFLVEKMGFGWEQVHEIAEQIEHVNSSLFFNKIDEMLGYPEIDPHGSPIPDASGIVKNINYQKLSDFSQNSHVILKALADTSDEFLTFLNDKKIYLGSEFKIISIENFDKSMRVIFNNETAITFSNLVCTKLFVEPVKPL